MGMLLYMMEMSQKQNNAAASGANKAPSKPTHVAEVKKNKEEPTPEPEPAKEKKLTRSDIMKMNVATVRAYAEEQGIKGANAMSGAELKRILGDKLFDESE